MCLPAILRRLTRYIKSTRPIASLVTAGALTAFIGHPQPAQAIELKCVSGGEAKTKALRSLDESAKTYYNASLNSLDAARAGFLLMLESAMPQCKISIGEARLGGKTGILISSTNISNEKTSVFCIDSTLKSCQVRLITTDQADSPWMAGEVLPEKIVKDLFAYTIYNKKDSSPLTTFFAPDISSFLPQVATAP